MKGGMEVLDYIIGAIVKTITYLFAVTISAIVSTQTYFLFMVLIINLLLIHGINYWYRQRTRINEFKKF